MSENNIILFQAQSKWLKITSLGATPKEVKGAIGKIIQMKFHYKFSMHDHTDKHVRSQVFSPSEILQTSSRGKQFTIVIKRSTGKYQFMGEFENDDDIQSFLDHFNQIRSNQQKNLVPRAKENSVRLHTNITSPLTSKNLKQKSNNFLTKTNNSFVSTPSNTPRQVLRERRDLGGKLFPSPNTLIETSPSGTMSAFDRIKQEDDDLKQTAIGAKKFYSGSENRTPRVANRFTYLKKSKLTRNPFNTFQERKESWKTEKTPEKTVVGFSNLGNTCYMNSILQCLLNIPSFFQDLNNELYLELVKHESLYNSLCNLGILKYSNESLENQRFALRRVKNAISAAATRFSGTAQHDAHEFLCQCLHQLNEDLFSQLKKQIQIEQNEGEDIITKLKQEYSCPVTENFESIVHHSIICEDCNEVVEKKEECNDFSLVIPEKDENSGDYELSIVDLLDFYFEDEIIEYKCTKCESTSAILTHEFEALPRILIFQIKRYDTLSTKLTDRIQLPKIISMSNHIVDHNLIKPKHYMYDRSKFLGKSMKSVMNESKRKLLFTANSSEPVQKITKVEHSSPETVTEISESFTKVKPIPPSPKLSDKSKFSADLTQFDNDDTIDFDFGKENGDVGKLTTVSEDEEEELQKALEMSLLDYEEKNKSNIENGFLNLKSSAIKQKISTVKVTKKANTSPEQNNNDISPEAKYHLVGIVNHHGSNTGTGHYTSDCYTFKNKKWYNFNDSSVKEASEHEVMYGRCQSAYLCFYMHASCYEHIADKCCQI